MITDNERTLKLPEKIDCTKAVKICTDFLYGLKCTFHVISIFLITFLIFF